jgi:hypothetical protein
VGFSSPLLLYAGHDLLRKPWRRFHRDELVEKGPASFQFFKIGPTTLAGGKVFSNETLVGFRKGIVQGSTDPLPDFRTIHQ